MPEVAAAKRHERLCQLRAKLLQKALDREVKARAMADALKKEAAANAQLALRIQGAMRRASIPASGRMTIAGQPDTKMARRAVDPEAAAKVAVVEDYATRARHAREGKAAKRAANAAIVSDETIRGAWNASNGAAPGRFKKVVDGEVAETLGVLVRRVQRARRGK